MIKPTTIDTGRMKRPVSADRMVIPMPPKTTQPTSRKLVGPALMMPNTVIQGLMPPMMRAMAPMASAVERFRFFMMGSRFLVWWLGFLLLRIWIDMGGVTDVILDFIMRADLPL